MPDRSSYQRLLDAQDELASLADEIAACARGADDATLASLALQVADLASRLHATIEWFASA